MKDRKITFQLQDAANHVINFQSLSELYDFFIQETRFWQEQQKRVNKTANRDHNYLNIYGNFQHVITIIDGWKDQINEWDDNQLTQQLNHSIQNYLQNIRGHWLWSGHPFVEPFILCLIEYGEETANAFLDYIFCKTLNNIQRMESFNGYMYGYEFVNQKSEITKRRNGEKVSLGHLRNQFTNSKNQLFSDVDNLKNGFEEWDVEHRLKGKRLYDVQKKLGERKIKNQKKLFDENLRNWSDAIAELEETYEEKLKLKKPAEYWNRAAKRYGFQGMLWTLCIIALVVVGLLYFREFFITWLQGKEIDVQLNSLQGLILFGSIAATYAFLLRVLSRLAFSSFHLMRDAEEREQLTYLYLSLTNESEVDKESRDIVLQALFSRSETGLLAQEHGPTMPGVGDLLKTAIKGQ
jgi:hypothetical protein